MSELKIFCDIDGVIWDIMGVFIEIYNRIYKENIKYEDVDDWYFFPQDRWEVVYPLTLLEINKYSILEEGISDFLFLLNEHNNVNMLTKEQNTIEVLKNKLTELDIVEGKQYNTITKLDIDDKKVNYKADIYIDDNPNIIKDMIDYPKRILLLFDQPWNQKYDVFNIKNVIRIYGWNDILIFINNFRISNIKYKKFKKE